MKPFHILFPLAVFIAATLPASGTEITKLSNSTALNNGGSWSGGTVPGSGNVALWDSTVTGPNSTQIGGDLSWGGIKITDVGGTRNGVNHVTIANALSANTLTLGTSGIDMAAAFQALVIQSKVTLAGDQTWNIANANTGNGPIGFGDDLAFFAQAAATFDLGGFTVTKSGVGNVVFSHGYSLSAGTIDMDSGTLAFQGPVAARPRSAATSR